MFEKEKKVENLRNKWFALELTRRYLCGDDNELLPNHQGFADRYTKQIRDIEEAYSSLCTDAVSFYHTNCEDKNVVAERGVKISKVYRDMIPEMKQTILNGTCEQLLELKDKFVNNARLAVCAA